MNAFWIFAVGLTVLYAIYYAVVICIDIYGKPKDQNQSSEETFAIDDLSAEESVAVERTDSGFRVARNGDDVEPQWQETNTVSSQIVNETETNAPDNKSSPAQQMIDAAQGDMEDIEPEMSNEMMSVVMKSALEFGKPPVPIKKEVIPAGSTTSSITQSDDNENNDSSNQVIDKI